MEDAALLPAIGLLRPEIVAQLRKENESSSAPSWEINDDPERGWEINDDPERGWVSFAWGIDTPAARSRVMKELCERWRDTGLWPDEISGFVGALCWNAGPYNASARTRRLGREPAEPVTDAAEVEPLSGWAGSLAPRLSLRCVALVLGRMYECYNLVLTNLREREKGEAGGTKIEQYLSKPFLESNHLVKDYAAHTLVHKSSGCNLLSPPSRKPPTRSIAEQRQASREEKITNDDVARLRHLWFLKEMQDTTCIRCLHSDPNTVNSTSVAATAVREGVEVLVLLQQLESENTSMKQEYIDRFPDDIPHINNLPTDCYHCFILKDANMVISCRQYD
ncbi:hypothetical protein K466DRAFT_567437 [Polyporus arcularius HHB13444]|uniref:Uncharacterized protein n=1 Tax=Polyporus arcularius HHB13444 TaxID=1314778 RepID=A0A5C3P346_9APHY|nr:hypothetical protein K466DRAFT_567437 [Polyporus arcularius HHB13444]